MSTRGGIVRITKSGPNGEPLEWAGRYHHWDSYPTSLGATLYELNRDHFKGDTAAMLRTLIDEHPAGWSTINGGDFTKPAGWCDSTEDREGPECYCHGGRSEGENLLTQENAASVGCEWIYAFNGGGSMFVLSSRCAPDRPVVGGSKMIGAFGQGDPKATWHPIGCVELAEPAPDWEKLEAAG
jgi:hypothetical protein